MGLSSKTIVALLFLVNISAFVVHADERSLAEVVDENESLRYQIANVESQIEAIAKEMQPPPGMVAVDLAEYEALVAQFVNENAGVVVDSGEQFSTLDNELARELINARIDLIVGRAKEFEVGSEETSSGFPVSRIEEVRQLSSELRDSVLLYTSKSEIIEGTSEAGTATAFLIEPDLAVTNSHNVRDEQGSLREAKITLYTFQGEAVNASVVGDDPGADVALLRLGRPLQLPVLKWGDIHNVSVGDPLFTIGHPARMGSWVTHVGVLEHFRSEELVGGAYHEKVGFSAPCMKGCSGSPVFDMNGDVVAVLYGSSSEVVAPLPLELYTSIRFLKEETGTGTAAHQASSLVTKFLAEESVK